MPTLLPSKKVQKEDDDAELNITSLMDAFTIILIFLLQSYGMGAVEVSEGYRPPVSKTRIEVDRILALQIREAGRDAIAYRIGESPEVAERKHASLGYSQLRADLTNEKKMVDAALTEEELRGAINIIADRTITYGTVLEVMKSAAGAGFFQLKLVSQP
jgi:biopolymer transport protein ExbD